MRLPTTRARCTCEGGGVRLRSWAPHVSATHDQNIGQGQGGRGPHTPQPAQPPIHAHRTCSRQWLPTSPKVHPTDTLPTAAGKAKPMDRASAAHPAAAAPTAGAAGSGGAGGGGGGIGGGGGGGGDGRGGARAQAPAAAAASAGGEGGRRGGRSSARGRSPSSSYSSRSGSYTSSPSRSGSSSRGCVGLPAACHASFTHQPQFRACLLPRFGSSWRPPLGGGHECALVLWPAAPAAV